MKDLIPLLFCALVAAGCQGRPGTAGDAASAAIEDRPPNIVIILADDLGIECQPLYGGRSHHTPNLDQLAAQGMRFTHCFSNPTCSPSRATLLTGRYSFRHGVKRVIWHEQRHANLYLRTDQPSFARQLKQADYTTAIAGKWQLSFLHRRNTIADFGFDTYQCWQIYDADLQKTRRFHEPHFLRDGSVLAEPIRDQYGPDVNTAFLSDFIKTSAGQDKPFLAYYTCLLPHYPWVPTPDSADKDDTLDDNTGKGDPKFFPDMVAYLDKSVGRLMDALDQAGVADNTVVIFLADNGTDQQLANAWGNAEGERVMVKGGKGTMTDRGTRVPLIVRWPGRVDAGTTCTDLVDFTDLLPTLCDISGAPLPEQGIHGRSFMPQLLGKPGTPRRWVHIQDKSQRHLRTRSHILPNQGELRPVVGLDASPAEPIRELSADERAHRRELQRIFDELDR